MLHRLATALFLAAFCLAIPPLPLAAQVAAAVPAAPSLAPGEAQTAPTPPKTGKKEAQAAAKAYRQGLDAVKHEQYEVAIKHFAEAVDLDPTRPEYLASRELTRQQLIKTLMTTADEQLVAKSRDAAKTLARIQEIDPQNPLLLERLQQLALSQAPPHFRRTEAYEDTEVKLDVKPGAQPFRIRGNTRSAYEQLARLFGLTVVFDSALPSKEVRMDVDQITFKQLTDLLMRMTGTFFVPVTSKQFFVAADTPENRKQYERLWIETFYFSEVSTPQDLNDIANLLRNLFLVRSLAVNQSANTITVKAPHKVLEGFSAIVDALSAGEPEVSLQVEVIDVSQTFLRQVGASLPLQFSILNIPTEERKLLGSLSLSQLNGLNLADLSAAALAALLSQAQSASASPLLQQPFLVFGGGRTLSAVTIPSTSITVNKSSSWVRRLQSATLLAVQGKDSTFRAGTRYPIVNSLFTSVSLPNLAGSASAAASQFQEQQGLPSISYEDLGITLKATPTIHMSSDVTLKLSLQIRSLGTQTLNSVPVINNQQYEGSVTLKEGEIAVVAGSMSKSNVKSVEGIPLISQIPGLGSLASQNTNQPEEDGLLILITPTLIRGAFAHSAEVWLPPEK